ncbi:MAG: ThaI family type II restriction endonuclease, partial [Planctomycetota bacterium]
PEIDAIVFNEPISIKTITDKKLGGVKAIWTVDRKKAKEFRDNYKPQYDILLAQIRWGEVGYLYYLPKKAQLEVLKSIGKNIYFMLPKQGTNPRGVEFSEKALNAISSHPSSLKIKIDWIKKEISYDPFKRWLDLWKRD